jgi:hypothetical protein
MERTRIEERTASVSPDGSGQEDPCTRAEIYLPEKLLSAEDMLTIIIYDPDTRRERFSGITVTATVTGDREVMPDNGIRFEYFAQGFFRTSLPISAFEHVRKNDGVLGVSANIDEPISVSYTDPRSGACKPETIVSYIQSRNIESVDSSLCACFKPRQGIIAQDDQPVRAVSVQIANNRNLSGSHCSECTILPWNETIHDVIVSIHLPETIVYRGEIHTFGNFSHQPGILTWEVDRLDPGKDELLNLFLFIPEKSGGVIVVRIEADNAASRLFAVPFK